VLILEPPPEMILFKFALLTISSGKMLLLEGILTCPMPYGSAKVFVRGGVRTVIFFVVVVICSIGAYWLTGTGFWWKTMSDGGLCSEIWELLFELLFPISRDSNI